MKLILILSSLLAMTAHADDNWLHKTIGLSNDISMSLDYTTEYLAYNDVGGPAGYLASPWINISGAGLKSTDQVSVVLISYDTYMENDINNPGTAPYQVSNQTIVLHYDATQSKFTGQSNLICLGDPQDYEAKYYEEVAVVINGTWYKNGDQNFRFQLSYN